ncbi:MAG: PilT domain-containing protein [Candidatus Magnetoglobus multicellularis str. Araruama]|uniref:PilT domain-containing protein n=1 Tax=Candidatus Magnetoglobus multicellularis str. Araruama TaxID=890399 RepID=A0A1V1P753_9BACT|nr:MAG: PilT domain-containing protein [Candidatus Magnetoglobus multicellularis str. Araruama]
MILLDSDVMIDLLREYPPAIDWLNSLDEDDELYLPGYVVMELIQGCRNKKEQKLLQKELAQYSVLWPLPDECQKALEIFTQYRLSHNAGLLDVLIGQTAVSYGFDLYTFNDKHYKFIKDLKTIQPYMKNQ